MRHQIVHEIVEGGVVAVVRMADAEKCARVVEAYREGGVRAIEVTMTTPDALDVIERVSGSVEDARIGVGSVLDGETARLAIEAGAEYVVSPIFDRTMIEVAHRYDVPAMPGCFTPTEIERAHEAGADVVKVFPAKVVGTTFFSAVKAPMPHLKLMPTGGVSAENAGDWIRAGAACVAAGSALFDRAAVERNDFDLLTENARTLRRAVAEAREG